MAQSAGMPASTYIPASPILPPGWVMRHSTGVRIGFLMRALLHGLAREPLSTKVGLKRFRSRPPSI